MDIEELKTQLAESAASWMNEVDSRIQAKAAIEQLQAENAKLKSELEEARKAEDALRQITCEGPARAVLIATKALAEIVAARQQQGDDAKG